MPGVGLLDQHRDNKACSSFRNPQDIFTANDQRRKVSTRPNGNDEYSRHDEKYQRDQMAMTSTLVIAIEYVGNDNDYQVPGIH